ncbi:DUF5666 domain-containing protein [Variovorax sp. J22R133]|uniref:DUF5666 domain-containing protein n=1 Tax=Variovorax brevis TaxID=3053503 RepID=UPI0025770961|nr:DUF5666 domain-containing protein [Variovorax sp. J22R133]MDM0114779.1 DUF5666 domain-containing protein [Variovorax sp. J22R133]
MTSTLLRRGLIALGVGLLLSCGGGGGGGNGAGVARTPITTSAETATSTTRTGLLADSPGGNTDGAATSTASTSTAASSGGDDGSGVGSGGTGVSASADGTGVGAVDGAGSIIVNGLRYDTAGVVVSIEDAPALQLGMTAKVTGPVNADFTAGVARRIESAADVRGPVASVDLAQGRFTILGTTITTDDATVWADLTGLGAVASGTTLQVWGLPAAPGVLLATRVEQHVASTPILSGTVQKLDFASKSFVLGASVIDYGQATLSGSPDGKPLANGTLVRVRANAVESGRLVATLVQWWYPVPNVDALPVQLAGVVTDYAGPASLKVLGFQVDASTAKITGGPAGSVGTGVRVEVAGAWANGVLKATKLKTRSVPGTGGPSAFQLVGNIGAFSSPSSFKVRGQPVDATDPGVEFVNGTASSLGNGVRVNIEGERVVKGVLVAHRVSFQ